MTDTNPLKTGAAFAATVGIGYFVCSLVFWLSPEAAATFMNALFHGLDFRKLQGGESLFRFDSFAYALVGLVGWAFAMGVVYGWISGRLGDSRS